jgi:hypothetical protein
MSTAPKRQLQGWWSEQDTQRAVAPRQQAADEALARLDSLSNAMRVAADLALDGMLDADAIRQMDLAQYRALRLRAGLADVDPFEQAHVGYEPQQTPGKDPAAVAATQNPPHSTEWVDVQSMDWETYSRWRQESGLAAKSDEGMSRASLSMARRYNKQDAGPQSGRTSFYRGA